MDLFETLVGFLKGAVGNNMGNAPEDVLTVKRGLSHAGYYDMYRAPEPHGYLTKAMDESVRNFQKDNNLRVDGTLLPGGETERSLYEVATGRSADEAFGRTQNKNTEKVGFGGNITGTIARIATPQRELLRASQTQPATRTGITRSARDLSEDDALPAGSFGHPAQNVDATGRAIREENITPPSENRLMLRPPIPGRKPGVDVTGLVIQDKTPSFSQILPGIDNDTLRQEIGGHEGRTEHLYKDTAKDGGVVTVGYGHALREVEDALKIPFMVKAPMSVRGDAGPMTVVALRPATPQEIKNAYNKVYAVRNGRKENIGASAFKPGHGTIARKYGLDDLILPEKEANKLFNADLGEHVKYVNQKLINDEIDPNTVPPSIMKALLDLQFNGAFKTKKERKHLTDTIKDRDWSQFKIEIQKYPISNGRDSWRPQQADEAVIWDKENYRK